MGSVTRFRRKTATDFVRLLRHVTCILIVTEVHTFYMQRKSFGKMACPIARSLERVGEWWSILIIRDALHGFTRFDQFQKSLNIAPNMLSRRLSALVDAGLLERRRYSERPPRYEYILTEMGRDFRPVIVAMFAWGNRHFAPEGASVLLVDKETRAKADPVLVDRRSGRLLNESDFVFAAGPSASARTRRRYAVINQKKQPGAEQSSRSTRSKHRGRKQRA
jgi:DNA-binding HxlR family transcriptional regulator